jgi:tetratricopeptide (TPR) repeat protein
MKILNKNLITSICLTIFFFWLPLLLPAQVEVQQAYILRMEGKADSAKVILEDLLTQDSTHALAWFELSRTLDHIRLGSPPKFMETAEIISCLDKAIELEPDNASFLYTRAQQEILNMYIVLMTGKPAEEAKENIFKAEQYFLQAAELDPAYTIGKLTLVEIFGQLDEPQGGDKAKAKLYASELKDYDAFMGAKAEAMLLGDTAKEVEFWAGKTGELAKDPRFWEAYGKSCLHEQNEELAFSCFDKAIGLDKSFDFLYLEKGRFYSFRAMQDMANKDKYLPEVEKAYNTYVDICPQATNPVKAWVYSNLARMKMMGGMQEEGKTLMEKATKLDPNHSKAFGFPAMDAAPDKVGEHLRHSYYFRPF